MMDFWMLELLLSMLIPMGMLFNGVLYMKKPPQYLDWMYGYRTRRSIRNLETWEFAQRCCGKVCCRWGTGTAIFVLLLLLSVLGMSEEIIGTIGAIIGIVEMLILLCAFVPIERALKQRFGV